VDGETGINTTDPIVCAVAVVDYALYRNVPAWLQVNLGAFYLVKTITAYFPTTGLGW